MNSLFMAVTNPPQTVDISLVQPVHDLVENVVPVNASLVQPAAGQVENSGAPRAYARMSVESDPWIPDISSAAHASGEGFASRVSYDADTALYYRSGDINNLASLALALLVISPVPRSVPEPRSVRRLARGAQMFMPRPVSRRDSSVENHGHRRTIDHNQEAHSKYGNRPSNKGKQRARDPAFPEPVEIRPHRDAQGHLALPDSQFLDGVWIGVGSESFFHWADHIIADGTHRNGMVVCPLCMAEVPKSKFQTHVGKHHPDQVFDTINFTACHQCNTRCGCPEVCASHIVAVHGDLSKALPKACRQCGEIVAGEFSEHNRVCIARVSSPPPTSSRSPQRASPAPSESNASSGRFEPLSEEDTIDFEGDSEVEKPPRKPKGRKGRRGSGSSASTGSAAPAPAGAGGKPTKPSREEQIYDAETAALAKKAADRILLEMPVKPKFEDSLTDDVPPPDEVEAEWWQEESNPDPEAIYISSPETAVEDSRSIRSMNLPWLLRNLLKHLGIITFVPKNYTKYSYRRFEPIAAPGGAGDIRPFSHRFEPTSADPKLYDYRVTFTHYKQGFDFTLRSLLTGFRKITTTENCQISQTLLRELADGHLFNPTMAVSAMRDAMFRRAGNATHIGFDSRTEFENTPRNNTANFAYVMAIRMKSQKSHMAFQWGPTQGRRTSSPTAIGLRTLCLGAGCLGLGLLILRYASRSLPPKLGPVGPQSDPSFTLTSQVQPTQYQISVIQKPPSTASLRGSLVILPSSSEPAGIWYLTSTVVSKIRDYTRETLSRAWDTLPRFPKFSATLFSWTIQALGTICRPGFQFIGIWGAQIGPIMIGNPRADILRTESPMILSFVDWHPRPFPSLLQPLTHFLLRFMPLRFHVLILSEAIMPTISHPINTLLGLVRAVILDPWISMLYHFLVLLAAFPLWQALLHFCLGYFGTLAVFWLLSVLLR